MAAHFITHFLSKAVHRFITRRVNPKSRPAAKGFELFYAPNLKSFLVTSLTMFDVFFIAFIKLVLPDLDKDSANCWLIAIASILAIGISLLILQIALKRVQFDRSGVNLNSMLLLDRYIAWHQITGYSFSKALSCHKLHLSHGRSIKLPILMSGLADFFQMLGDCNPAMSDLVTSAQIKQIEALRDLGA